MPEILRKYLAGFITIYSYVRVRAYIQYYKYNV